MTHDNINNEGEHTLHTHGSSAVGYSDPIDQERASSMADEGGVSAARQDALEQSRAHQDGKASAESNRPPLLVRVCIRLIAALRHRVRPRPRGSRP